jgi:hypothetical protein
VAGDAKGVLDASAQSLIKTANVKVKLSKAELYTEEAHWLGLVLTKDGVRQDGSRGCRVWRPWSAQSRVLQNSTHSSSSIHE